MGIGDGIGAHLAPHERVHGAALDQAGTDQRDLDREVVEGSGLEPGEKADLRARFDLEHADRIGAAEHVIHGGLLAGELAQVEHLARGLADDVEAVLQRGEHAEPEQVELHEPHPRGIVLVPLDDGATGHARVLDRHDLADGPIGEHHAARVDAEVAGRAHDAHGVFEHLIGDSSWSPPDSIVAPQRSICRDQASCWPGEKPRARATSRTAFFGRYWMTLATWAARSRPCCT